MADDETTHFLSEQLQNTPICDWPRKAKTVMWLIGLLTEMALAGDIENDWMMTAHKGLAAYDQIKAESFVPTTSEVLEAATDAYALFLEMQAEEQDPNNPEGSQN